MGGADAVTKFVAPLFLHRAVLPPVTSINITRLIIGFLYGFVIRDDAVHMMLQKLIHDKI